MQDKNFRKVKNIGKDLQKHYRGYFERNASKFIWKWEYEMEDLDKIFINNNHEYTLIGQVSERTFLLSKNEDETHWFVEGNVFQNQFTRK